MEPEHISDLSKAKKVFSETEIVMPVCVARNDYAWVQKNDQ